MIRSTTKFDRDLVSNLGGVVFDRLRLITNRKCFRCVQTSMTLNDLNGKNHRYKIEEYYNHGKNAYAISCCRGTTFGSC